MSVVITDGTGGEWHEDGTPTPNSTIQEPLDRRTQIPKKPSYEQIETDLASARGRVKELEKAGRNYIRAEALYNIACFKSHWFVVSESSYQRAKEQWAKWRAYAGALFCQSASKGTHDG